MICISFLSLCCNRQMLFVVLGKGEYIFSQLKYQSLFCTIVQHFYRAAWNADAVQRWEFCPSVFQTRRLWQNERKSVQIFIPYERSFIIVFWEKERMVGATPFTWNFGSTDPHWSEIADFEQIIARNASTVTPSEKSSINTNRKSLCTFQWA